MVAVFLSFSVQVVFGTNRIVHGFSKDASTGKPIPFPKITVEGSLIETLGDMEGTFSVVLPEGRSQVVVHAYQYLEAVIDFQDGDSIRAYLYYAHPFTFQTITTPPAKNLVRQILKKRSEIDPRKERNYQYQSYNKLVITTSYVSAVKVYIDNLLRTFTPFKTTAFSIDHHIFLMESASDRSFKRFYKQKENVAASRVSGISKPPPLSLVSGFEPLSIYEPFLRIGSRRYISPLAGRPLKRYIFFLSDSIRAGDQTIYVLKFNPKSFRNKDLLQGFIYVSKNPTGVIAFQVWPAFDRESTFSLLQNCQLLPSGRWFPSEIKTTFNKSRLGSMKIPITATSKTYIFNHAPLEENKRTKFNEVVFEFQDDLLSKEKEFPTKLRQEPLSMKDKNTFVYYDKIGSIKAIDQYLTLGQKLAAGRFPFGKIDLVFRKAVTVNYHEGLRLGLGLQTTHLLSEKNQGGGYFARGSKDNQWKFGLNYQFSPNEKDAFTANWKKDITEPGIFQFAFNTQQYSTEQLRTLRISRFDVIRSAEVGWNHQWTANFKSRIAAEGGRRDYLYAYRYLPKPNSDGIDIAELSLDLHWAPGEQFARFGHEKVTLGSKFPAFWLQVSKGIGSLSNDAFNYTRVETKMQWTRRILGLGEFGIQCVAGIQDGEIPYPLLFSNRASYRDFSFLSYNSFETMRYNEFLQDRFVSVFFSHKFSKMQLSTLPYRPYFTLLHNMGWGSISNPENHRFILDEVQDMPKGFFESGLFLNDLFVIPLGGLNLSMGTGMFLRYGRYALDGYLNNLAFKFSTNLGF